MPLVEFNDEDEEKVPVIKTESTKKIIRIPRKTERKPPIEFFSSNYKRKFFSWIRGLNTDDYPHQRSTINQFVNWNKERTYVHLLELLEMYMEVI